MTFVGSTNIIIAWVQEGDCNWGGGGGHGGGGGESLYIATCDVDTITKKNRSV